LGYWGKKSLNHVKNTQVQYINIPWQEQEAEGLLEEEVDVEPGKQPEVVVVDWDTLGAKIIRLCEKHPDVLY
jgi:predicted enzyme related to lactoylglutathione lyase